MKKKKTKSRGCKSQVIIIEKVEKIKIKEEKK